MKSLDFLYVVAAIALTAICWGAYGPVLHRGQTAMEGSRLRPLLCVGIAYFVIAVIVPLAVLYTRGEKGDWTFSGAVWSTVAASRGRWARWASSWRSTTAASQPMSCPWFSVAPRSSTPF